MIELYNGDCLEVMDRLISKGIKVDMILTDPPYGTTACKWDSVIPFDDMWKRLNLLIKDNTPILLFGSEPFSSQLRVSNLKMYKYDLYWKKEKPTNFMQLKRRFGKVTENICIFYGKQPTFNPQMVKHNGKLVKNKPKSTHNSIVSGVNNTPIKPYNDTGFRYPSDILEFRRVKLMKYQHPTQKPVDLLEYLIKTYTNENELVLDFTMGSGSTGVACKNTNRNFIGIELDEKYFEIAKDRIENTVENKENFELW